MRNLGLSVFTVAHHFVGRSEPRGIRSMTHLKLQKLIYFAWGFAAAYHDVRLFNENFVAWRHGPVCVELYEAYKHHSYRRIDPTSAKPVNLVARMIALGVNDNLALDVVDVLDEAWRTFGVYDGPNLETFSTATPPYVNALATGVDTVINLDALADHLKQFTDKRT